MGRSAAPKESLAQADIDDFADNPTLYRLLRMLPTELRREHINRIEHLEDEEAEGYLYALHERRDAALRESQVSDDTLRPYFESNQERLWQALENEVFTSEENHLGAGTTARIKRLDLTSFAPDAALPESLAVKYLVTPNSKTLSASGEHDMVAEVEQMQAIERAELAAIGVNARVRVPHPYFYYQKGKTQCYGMERIDGVNLDQGISGSVSPTMREELARAFADVDREALFEEIDMFFDTMHGICIHGDIKPRNLMASRDGKIYVIDFGQAVLATAVDEKSQAAFEELKEAEKSSTRDAVRFFLDALKG